MFLAVERYREGHPECKMNFVNSQAVNPGAEDSIRYGSTTAEYSFSKDGDFACITVLKKGYGNIMASMVDVDGETPIHVDPKFPMLLEVGQSLWINNKGKAINFWIVPTSIMPLDGEFLTMNNAHRLIQPDPK